MHVSDSLHISGLERIDILRHNICFDVRTRTEEK